MSSFEEYGAFKESIKMLIHNMYLHRTSILWGHFFLSRAMVSIAFLPHNEEKAA